MVVLGEVIESMTSSASLSEKKTNLKVIIAS